MTKAERLIDAVGYLDDDLIEEAEQVRFRQKAHKTYSRPMRIAAIAACCAMFVFGAFLFPRFFIRLGKQAGDAAPAMQMETTNEAKAEAETVEMEEAAVMEESKAAFAENEAEAVPEEAGTDGQTLTTTTTTEETAEDVIAAGGATYGEAIFFWPDEAATVTVSGTAYQAMNEERLNRAGLGDGSITIDMFDLSRPDGKIAESSDETLVGSAYYLAVSDTAKLVLVQTPDGLYLFGE